MRSLVWRSLCCIWLVSALEACGPREEVHLGQAESRTLDLDVCFATSCAPTREEPESFEAGEVEPCAVAGEPLPLEVRWRRTLLDRVECPEIGACRLLLPRIAVADDGSIWVLAEATATDEHDPRLRGLWLALYDPEGELLHERMAAVADDDPGRETFYRYSMVSVHGSHLALAVFEHTDDLRSGAVAQRSWLVEYDAQGEPVGSPIVLRGAEGGALLFAAGSATIAVASTDGSGIAWLDLDGQPRWTQNGLGSTSVSSLVADANGNVSVLGRSGEDWMIESFDVSGEFVWRRTLDDGVRTLGLLVDGTDLFRVGLGPVDPAPEATSVDIRVHALDAQGAALWARDIAGPNGCSVYDMAVIGPEVLIAASGHFGREHRHVVFALSTDGASCRWYAADSFGGTQLVGHAGRLYFAERFAFGSLAL